MDKNNHKVFSLLIGRYQCLPPHKGHLSLINSVLNEGKNVLIALRQEDGTDKNPYTQEERRKCFNEIYKKEIEEGKVIIIDIPDIEEVCYGRDVGWGIREIKLSKDIEAISASEIRANKENK